MSKFILRWTNSYGKKCNRSFDVIHDRTLFAHRLYLEKYDLYGKISIKPPVKSAIDAAISWASK
jgi:hypothetical protein